jgi:hypothetical protein
MHKNGTAFPLTIAMVADAAGRAAHLSFNPLLTH